MDEIRQRALERYYIASGASGIAIGVHTTQFDIRHPDINLLEPVLELTSKVIDSNISRKPVIKVVGICGTTNQEIAEAKLAIKHDCHRGLVSMGGLHEYTETDLLERARQTAKVIPLFGFYLQPAVGGRVLSYRFWKEFVEIPNVHAIKIAAFNRYRTLDVVRAVIESDRRDDIALYTGNDDHIIGDLLTPFHFKVNGTFIEKRVVGGLLGHWAVWTSKAVELLHEIRESRNSIPERFLTLNAETTDANAAIFDAANNFKGCIPGVHEVLRRQGLLHGTWSLNPDEVLSEGQKDEIDRIYDSYPHLHDDAFVNEHLDEFLKS